MRRVLKRRAMAAAAVLTMTAAMSVAATGIGDAARAAGPPPACPTSSSSAQPLYMDTSYSFTERAADLVSCMSLAEKVDQLHTTTAPAIPRLGVQGYDYWQEAQHGVLARATSFPVNFASTMSWDPALINDETTAIADEARGFQNQSCPTRGNFGSQTCGSLTYFAPTVNMDRDPRWGRTDEAFGEDPFLVSQMAGAFVDGFQGQTLSGQPMTPYMLAAATAKHYALNNVENNRTTGSSNTDDANIRDYYTRQFGALAQDAHVAGVMTSYNAINGTPAPADTYTANELLQRTYGFNGYTTSDCGAVELENTGHNWAPPGWTTNGTTWTNTATGQTVSAAAGAQAFAVRAGTQLNCTGASYTLPNIEEAIKAGILSEGVIDNALVHLFTLRMQTGEFDPPSQVLYTGIHPSTIESPAHQALAEKVAANDLVLLKNDNVAGTSAPLLPVDPAKLNNVVIVGNMANTVTLGGYSGSPSLRVNAVQGITSAVKAANPNAAITFDACGTSTTATAPASCSAATQAALKTADLVVVFAGTDGSVQGEGLDRSSLAMPGNYNSLISQVAAAGNPRTALVIQSDGPVDISATQGDFPAIVFSGYNGESQGTALADVLTGKQNPAGHLDFTWYKDASQLPDIQNYGLTPSQTGGLGRTYQYFTGTPTYPFGYGLSYAKFSYSHISIASRSVDANATVPVSFDVTNTGTVAGSTVAQLYVAPQFTVAGVQLPKEQLAGFQKTSMLAPGQTQQITLQVKLTDLSRWDESKLKQVVDDGPYQFRVGPDAATVAGSGTVTVTGSIAEHVQDVTVQPDQVVFQPGATLDLTGKNPWIKDDTNSSLEQPHAAADNIVEAVNNDQSFVDLSKAEVSYASSNPGVAMVSSSGKLTTVAQGTTTVSVTVNGITATTPIVVRYPLTVTPPAIAIPGSPATATTTFANTSSHALTNLSMTLAAPGGWTVTPTTPASFATVAAGQTVQTTWHVTAPVGTAPGRYELVADAAFTDTTGEGSSIAAASTSVPFPSLPAAFNNPGISDNSNPGAGNLDGSGDSFSQQSLEAAGLSPGATITEQGITYTWPNVPAGQPDNVQTDGQVILLNAAGSTLGFLGMADFGEHTDSGTITYTDGSTQSYTLTYPDWFTNGPDGTSDQLVATGTVNGPFAGTHVGVYAAEVPLQAGKTVAAVTLPSDSDIHVFALGIGCCALSASAPATVTPGQTASVRTVLTNAGNQAVTNASVSLNVPSGWTATPGGPATAGSLGAGQSLTTDWSLSVPSSAACGAYPLHATATLSAPDGGAVALAQDARTSIVCSSVPAAFNNPGISDDSNPSAGNLDGSGDSFSEQSLEAAGLSPGATVTEQGITYTWPNVPAGQPDNVATAGQVIAFTGSGATLGFLGTAAFGEQTGSGTITYIDGSTQAFTLSFPDWFTNAPDGTSDQLVATGTVNGPFAGTHVGVYAAEVPLVAGKTISTLTLPSDSNMHIFAVGVG